MRLIAAFLRMIRLPNLLFIALTQLLFQFCIYYPLYEGRIPAGDTYSFILLLFASLFIAAAGYIINDYFDINIDEVNKPDRMVVDKFISRRWAIAWHFMLSISGLVLTALAVPLLQKWYLLLINAGCVALLWFYSTSFKKKLLIGNLVIALLIAWTILVVFFSKMPASAALSASAHSQLKFFRFAFLYAGFAFIATLIREAVKDMEDLPGDARYGCRTMPVVWGIHATKVYTAVWIIILLVVLLVIQVYVLQFGWWLAVVYSVVAIILPLLYVFSGLFKAGESRAFRRLSTRIKWMILAGILSMIFFYFYL
ncbi:MAG TPA: geranylgeranylglycerol-phosphate geranylgeranyltransferase [Chitinophagaceae bacterium]|nr:geranylgeranylglycerol-phosphate geranylgeranyltransferase [Chitinophagaceae bacterium]